MRGLEDKTVREDIEVDLVGGVPYAQKGNEVLLSHLAGNPLAHQVLIRQAPLERSGVVELEPMDLLSRGTRLLHMAGAALE